MTDMHTAIAPEEYADTLNSPSEIDVVDLPDRVPIPIRELFERLPKVEPSLNVDTPGAAVAASPDCDPRKLSETTRHILNLPKISDLKAEMKWLIPGLVPVEQVVMMSGESGCGKSTVALSLANAVANGKPFLGRPVEKRHVLILDRENGSGVYAERFKRMHIQENEFLHIWGQWATDPPGPEGRLEQVANDLRPLMIFDSLVAFHTGKEQDANDTRKYMDGFRRLSKEGATVLVIHHTGKGENTKEYRGSSDIKASIDVGLLLSAKQPNLRALELKPIKLREGVTDPVMFAWDGKEFVSQKDKDREIVEDIIRADPGINKSRICRLALHVSEARIDDILRSGEAAMRLHKEKGPSNSWCYTLSST